MAPVHLFSRPDINNISPLRAAGEKNWQKGEGEGKVGVAGGQTAIKRMKAREILVYTYKI